MANDWEPIFSRWAQPPSQTEQDRIDNTIRAIRQALDKNEKLSTFTKVYVQGSYRNRVNVRQDSDVDIGVLYTGDVFYTNYPEGKTDDDFGNVKSSYTYKEFKDEIELTLVNHFGRPSVTRGNKAFDIHANTYRVDADVVPVFEHRRYNSNGSYISGVQLNPDDGGIIVNWPERLYDKPCWPNQHYENAVAKNTATNRSYKGVVRILKKLRNKMEEEGLTVASPISGFLVECLAWNAPNSCFSHETWDEIVQSVLLHLWSNTKSYENCQEWGEVSELKYLFKGSPATKREQAHAFVNSAWDYVGIR